MFPLLSVSCLADSPALLTALYIACLVNPFDSAKSLIFNDFTPFRIQPLSNMVVYLSLFCLTMAKAVYTGSALRPERSTVREPSNDVLSGYSLIDLPSTIRKTYVSRIVEMPENNRICLIWSGRLTRFYLPIKNCIIFSIKP